MGENNFWGFGGKPKLGSRVRRWEFITEWHIQEIGWSIVDWIHVAVGWDFSRYLVDTIMGVWSDKVQGIFLTVRGIVICCEGFPPVLLADKWIDK